MKSKNICKFTTVQRIDHALTVSCFVRETNVQTMREPHALSRHRMMLFVQGSGSFAINSATYAFRAGTLLFAFSGENVALADGENVVYMYIDFEGARADELMRRFDVTPLSRSTDGLDGMIPLWQEGLARAREHTIDLVAESILLHSFSRLCETETANRGIIGSIAEITDECFNDPELSISVIAQRLSYNPKYLSHYFKEKTGMSYSEYLRSVRLNYAVSLFNNGIDSVKNVAILSGFSDPLYFSNVFKKHIGMSPKAYVEKMNISK